MIMYVTVTRVTHPSADQQRRSLKSLTMTWNRRWTMILMTSGFMRILGLTFTTTPKSYCGNLSSTRYQFLSSFLASAFVGTCTTLAFITPATCDAADEPYQASDDLQQQRIYQNQNPRYIDSQLQMQYANVGTFF